MSYSSRVYRHRNLHSHDEPAKEPFFAKQNDKNKSNQKAAFFQAKLSVNEPGDQYETEADSVANAVVNNKSSAPVLQQKKVTGIQKLSTSMEDEKLSTNDARMARDKEIQEKPIQRISGDPEKEKLKGVQKMGEPKKEEEDKVKAGTIQTKQDAGANPTSPQVSARIENSSGKGHALPPQTLNEMNASFGVNLGGVRIHNDGEATEMSRQLQAQAFTYGYDIYFNNGKYNPQNREGRFLIAHELTHVLQQNGNGYPGVQRSCHDGKCGECIGGTHDFWITFYFRRKATAKTMSYLRTQITEAKKILSNCCLNLKSDFNWTLMPGGGTFNFMDVKPDGSWNYSNDAATLGTGNSFKDSRGIPVLVVDDVPASGGGVTVDTRFDASYTGRTYAVIGVNQTNPNPSCNHLAHELWHIASGIVGHEASHGSLAACLGNNVSSEYCHGLREIVAPIGDFPEAKKNVAYA